MNARNLVPLGVSGIWQFTLAEHESKLLQDYLYYSQLPLLAHDRNNDTEVNCGSLVRTCTLRVIYCSRRTVHDAPTAGCTAIN